MRRVLSIAGFLGVAAAGCAAPELPGRANAVGRPVPPDRVLAFAPLYAKNCSGCHGADGRLGPAPPLNDPLFRALATVDELRQVVSRGRPGTPMPAFARDRGGSLTAEQVQVLADGIAGVQRERLTVRPGGGFMTDAGPPPVNVPAWGAVTPPPADAPPLVAAELGDVARGRAIFATACASCHGDGGAGIADGDNRRHRINNPAFLALMSDQQLRRLIITGRPDLHMPDYASATGRPPTFRPLTTTDVADVVALLGSWRTINENP
jgi:mono/diheme cytochrome c family protein